METLKRTFDMTVGFCITKADTGNAGNRLAGDDSLLRTTFGAEESTGALVDALSWS
jgi:hypothetical protein